MTRNIIGGPKDGASWECSETDDPEGLCVPLGNDHYACYYRVCWPAFQFIEDGNYHFYKTVSSDDLTSPAPPLTPSG